MAPVDLVTIHHEGSLANGGAPTDDVGRFREGGYCCGLGATMFERWRAPEDAYATLNFNGEDWCPCYSGDHHTGTELRDADIELLHAAYLDAYERGEVTAEPLVRAHRDSPGSSTACPGDYVIDRWADVVAACRPGAAPPQTDENEVVEMPTTIMLTRSTDARGNEQPYLWLDVAARRLWSYYGAEVAWEGGDGDSTLHGAADPHYSNIPGSAKVMSWAVLDHERDGSVFDTQGGTRKRVCVTSVTGAEYFGVVHA
jgi:hypothetical protein